MIPKKMMIGLAALAVAGIWSGGCGSAKRLESTQVPGQPGAGEAAGKVSPAASGHYLVRPNDCLWAIAGKPDIYGDSFEWPLIFKTNRDQIQDPDLIYPRQKLKIATGFSMEERGGAKRLAMETPKYVPHSKPRETLPLDYF